jgi:signal transduction histidine kinase
MRFIRSLWWKLALSYVAITLAVVIVAMGVFGPLLGEQDFRESLRPAVLELPIQRAVRLLHGRINDAPLCAQVLNDLVRDLQGGDQHAAAVANHLASSPTLSALSGAQPKASVAIYDVGGASLYQRTDPSLPLPMMWLSTSAMESKGPNDIQIVLPMDQMQTIVVRFQGEYNFWRQFGESEKEIGFSIAFQLLFYLLPGAVFGALIAAWLTSRLRRFSALATRWASGDFSQRLRDTGRDELSQHADLLDRMADDLSAHLLLQQQLHTAEARNHLARELHDSVKQQCFGVGLQLHAAQAWLHRDLDKSQELLAQAQSLNQSVQAELVGILQRLKHAGASAPSFEQSLQELAAQWANEIDIEVQVMGDFQLSESIAHELLRIASEALANVVRHAHAKRCTLQLVQLDERMTLSIRDDGCGFEVAQVRSGLGLHSLRERAQALPNGAMSLHSSPSGTALCVSWSEPLQSSEKGTRK